MPKIEERLEPWKLAKLATKILFRIASRPLMDHGDIVMFRVLFPREMRVYYRLKRAYLAKIPAKPADPVKGP